MDIICVVALGAAIAGFTQGLSGFAFGMVSMSIWVWVLDPHEAAALVVFGSLIGQLMAVFIVKRGFKFSLLWPFIAGGLLGIPIGVALLPTLDTNWFKLIVGLFLIVWCPSMLFNKSIPHLRGKNKWINAIVGVVGGIMSGVGGFSGVIATLWCTLCGYEKDIQRNIVQNFSLSILSVTMVAYISTGLVATDMLPMFAVVLPAMLIPTWLGMRVYTKIHPDLFRFIILCLLTFSGISMLISSVPQLL